VDLFFSPVSKYNMWGQEAPLYGDVLGYQGSVGIRDDSSHKLNIISVMMGGK